MSDDKLEDVNHRQHAQVFEECVMCGIDFSKPKASNVCDRCYRQFR